MLQLNAASFPLPGICVRSAADAHFNKHIPWSAFRDGTHLIFQRKERDVGVPRGPGGPPYLWRRTVDFTKLCGILLQLVHYDALQ